MEAPGAQPSPERPAPAAASGRRLPTGAKRGFVTLLCISAAGLLAGLQDSAGREAHGTLGVSLTISAGCTVATKPASTPVQNTGTGSVEQKIAVSVSCTNDVPYQLGITSDTETASPAEPAPQITLAPGFRFDAVSLIVTY